MACRFWRWPTVSGDAAWNETAFANAEFDALLAEAMSIADADKRREVMAKIEKLMQDEGVMIQPYWRSLFRHAKPNVMGADMHPTFEIHHAEILDRRLIRTGGRAHIARPFCPDMAACRGSVPHIVRPVATAKDIPC